MTRKILDIVKHLRTMACRKNTDISHPKIDKT